MKYDWIMDKSDQQQMVRVGECRWRRTGDAADSAGADHNFGRHGMS
jgi:hypothetical protein